MTQQQTAFALHINLSSHAFYNNLKEEARTHGKANKTEVSSISVVRRKIEVLTSITLKDTSPFITFTHEYDIRLVLMGYGN